MSPAEDLRTHVGTVRGGLPADAERVDIAFIIDEPGAGRVRIHVARVEVDPANLGVARADRDLEVVASFWMTTDHFVSTFGRVAGDIERKRRDR